MSELRVEWVEPLMARLERARQAGSMSTTHTSPSLRRPRTGRVIAGVCAAIADRFGWSTTVVRLIFLFSILLPGPQVLLYVVLWIFIPKES
jgi:phage shock protein PspC (stress-responsive transcriptional regulator)